MQAPVCEKCIKSGVLCDRCKKKLEEDQISKLDIELAARLQDMESRGLVKNPSFEKTFLVGDLMLVLTTGNPADMIGRKGRVVRHLTHELGRTVRIIKKGNLKTELRDLLAPARIIGINKIYTPGTEKTKVIIPHEDREKLIAATETMEKAARLLSGDQDLKIVTR